MSDRSDRSTSPYPYDATPKVFLKSHPHGYGVVKQIHVWPNHVRIPHLNLVLPRPKTETLARSLSGLAKLGFDTRSENVELHGDVRPL